jgi:transcriptional regulator with XRE-family HTH domain
MAVMTFGDRIKELRRAKGWTQVEFADRMGVNNRHVSRWEKSKNRPTGRTLDKMAEVFEMTPEELFGNLVATREPVPDPELHEQFKEIQNLPEAERAAIRMVLDAFLTKRRVEQVLHSPAPSKRAS